MNKNTFLIIIALIVCGAVPAEAQFDKLKEAVKGKTETEQPKEKPGSETESKEHGMYNEEDPVMVFIGKDGLDGEPIAEFEVCAGSSGLNTFQLKKRFKKWITDISPTAMEKSYAGGTCRLMGYAVRDDSDKEKEKKVAELETRARGDSLYEISGDSLALVRDYVRSSLYVVVTPAANKSGLALKDLYLGVKPDLKATYRRKTRGVYNYHDLDQALYIFEKYKKYPGANAADSVLFSGADFETLNKQGKFKGLVVYRLVGERLVPFE
jgi:hypothetical protein